MPFINKFGGAAPSRSEDTDRYIQTLGLRSAADINILEYITMSSTGNMTDFGDSATAGGQSANGLTSGARGVYKMGYGAGAVAANNVIEYITMATTGNGTDFGNTGGTTYTLGCIASATRGLFYVGHWSTGYDTIEYITIDSTGNATDFGNATELRRNAGGGGGSETRGIQANGIVVSSAVVTIDYVTIASTGNATDFGDTSTGIIHQSACSNSTTRYVITGGLGTGGDNVMQYVTIASTGNTTDFGDLTLSVSAHGAGGNSVRGISASGGLNKSGWADSDVIDYITIASTGNATDFGNLSAGSTSTGSISWQLAA